ncbi:MAG TPA: flagellar basal-body MS-ring/collar protein FliF [Rhodanobacteraceae bacterium]
MAKPDWRNLAGKARARLRAAPKWTWIVGGIAALTGIILVVLASGGPAYTPLYDGLSSKQGGQVIEDLQKLGIPYSLNATGSIISVPAPDLARARLQLGKMNVPADAGSEAWSELTQGSLTRDRVATDALRKRALEASLEKAIDGIRGVAASRVDLAIPSSTPFLGDQPKPKASVWLHTTLAGVAPTQARAIAQMVASSVPGLGTGAVTVTDQNGDVLAPIKAVGYAKAQQELALTRQIERATDARVQALLTPLVGAHNFRVSASAAVDFDKVATRQTRYGPAKVPLHVKQQAKQRTGDGNAAQGIPGALSNEPPAQATARAAPPPRNGAAPAAGTPAAAATAANAASPHSGSQSSDTQYDVDQTVTESQGAPWHLQAMSVSVVLNKAVATVDPQLSAKVKAIVTNALSAPKVNVNIATVAFAMQKIRAAKHGFWASIQGNGLLTALLALLAALFALIGIAAPLSRWLERFRLPELRQPAAADGDIPVRPSEASAAQRAATEKLRRSVRVASEKPKEAAETIKRWLADAAVEPPRGKPAAEGGGAAPAGGKRPDPAPGDAP